jgi:hypothetical protein
MPVDPFLGTKRMVARLLKGSTSADADSMSDDALLGAKSTTERLLMNSPDLTVM